MVCFHVCVVENQTWLLFILLLKTNLCCLWLTWLWSLWTTSDNMVILLAVRRHTHTHTHSHTHTLAHTPVCITVVSLCYTASTGSLPLSVSVSCLRKQTTPPVCCVNCCRLTGAVCVCVCVCGGLCVYVLSRCGRVHLPGSALLKPNASLTPSRPPSPLSVTRHPKVYCYCSSLM